MQSNIARFDMPNYLPKKNIQISGISHGLVIHARHSSHDTGTRGPHSLAGGGLGLVVRGLLESLAQEGTGAEACGTREGPGGKALSIGLGLGLEKGDHV